jgi:hypothetical protein
MKKPLLIILLIVSQGGVCALLGEERDWRFIQSVGGIAIGLPVAENNDWLLPVNCNVAGLREITVKPTMLNSGLVWADTEVSIKGGIIYLSIKTALVGIGGGSSDCGPANLGKIEPGKYSVMYLGADQSTNSIGEVEIGLYKSG